MILAKALYELIKTDCKIQLPSIRHLEAPRHDAIVFTAVLRKQKSYKNKKQTRIPAPVKVIAVPTTDLWSTIS